MSAMPDLRMMDPQSATFEDLNRVIELTDRVLTQIPDMPDERVLQLREYSEQIGKQAWRITCACDAEILKRTHARKGRGNKDTEGVGVIATVTRVAAEAGVAPQKIFRNAQIHNTFFTGENALDVQSIYGELDQSFYDEALRHTANPRAAIELLAEKKEDNPFYSARDARKDIQALRDGTTRDLVADLPRVGERYTLHLGHLALAGEEIAANSIDLVVTDPPYEQDALPLYEELAVLSARVLKPGGSLLVMCGQSYLPEVLLLLLGTPGLRYHWTLAYLTPGGQAVQLWQRKVNTFWKPVLWLVKGDYAGGWIGDVARSAVNDNDKEHHHWGQSESGMYDLLKRLAKAGDHVLDPFVGGGTTGVVALDLDCLFTGIDVSEAAIRTSAARLSEAATAREARA